MRLNPLRNAPRHFDEAAAPRLQAYDVGELAHGIALPQAGTRGPVNGEHSPFRPRYSRPDDSGPNLREPDAAHSPHHCHHPADRRSADLTLQLGLGLLPGGGLGTILIILLILALLGVI
jgi:hypothetical protein